MDQELITYLDQRFTAIDQRFIAIDQRFTSLDQKIESLREETMQRFEQVDRRFEQVDRRFEQVDRRFEQVEDRIHQTQITVEKMNGDIRLVAEAWIGFNERQDSFREEAAANFKELRMTVRLPYEDLDRRVKVLETRAQHEGRDPVDIVREIQEKLANGTFGR
jgi:chromosome segregation ATPase